ncbi:hypothetical protein MtrunA17_Chr1g0207731 [Medicago truncatula]|uniref:Uncharacterized protein n=1 Tax=Medicago truncatula TaxID=3880 RepID=A0A396K214_MEDTR|nr:hypothetical protein MtrunA17_Chr1g0207731 [Medicago truncatula]
MDFYQPFNLRLTPHIKPIFNSPAAFTKPLPMLKEVGGVWLRSGKAYGC